jgi:PPOX class probable F420-dependent enzyme
MPVIPESHAGILNKKSFAHVATLNADGSPQVTPVWADYDGEHIVINSAKGRKKDRNMRARPQVGVSVQDPDNPYRYLGVEGVVEEITEDGATAHIHALSRKYTGQDYDLPADQTRVIYRIRPISAWTMG